MNNPYKFNCAAWRDWNFYHGAHKHKPISQIEALLIPLRKEAGNWCRYSSSMMMKMDFEIKIMEQLIDEKFAEVLA